MSRLLQNDDFVYSFPMLSVMIAKRLVRHLTPWTRRVDVEVDSGFMPPPENQHIDGRKWRHFITLSFNRSLPPIGWDQTKDFNSFLLMTETDRLLIGANFVTVFTDDLSAYDTLELTQAACRAFGLDLQDVKQRRL